MSTLPATTIQDIGKALTQGHSRAKAADGDVPFLRLLKDGVWVYGADDIEVQDGSNWAVNPATIHEGFCAWGDSELAGEDMQPMVGGTPVILSGLAALGSDSEGKPILWKPQLAFEMVCINGDDKSQKVLYKTSSKGGIKAAKTLLAEIITQIESGDTDIVPLVSLDVDSYKHKKHGKIYTPTLSVKAWASLEATQAEVASAEVDADDKGDDATQTANSPPPKKRRRAVAT